MLTKAELRTALKVFSGWLEEEGQRANAAIGESFDPANVDGTTLAQLAELKGISRAYFQAGLMLAGRIDTMPDED